VKSVFLRVFLIVTTLSSENLFCVQEIPDILKKNNFSWIVDGVIAGIAMPQSKDETKALHDLNIGLVVTLTEHGEGPDPAIFEGIDVERLFLPIKDFHVPQINQVDKFVNKSAQVLKTKGKATVVHCMGGKGRTGTMLACWALVNKNMTPFDAVMFVRNKRPGSIETEEQVEFVEKYYATLLKRQLKKLKAVEEKMKESTPIRVKLSAAKKIAKERKAKGQADTLEAVGEFYSGIEEEQRLKILKEKLGNLKESLVLLDRKFNELRQKMLLLKEKMEKGVKKSWWKAW
jgi:atypical dual specificity phosphatase